MNVDRTRETDTAVGIALPTPVQAPLSLVGLAYASIDAAVITCVATVAGALYGYFVLSIDVLSIVHLKLALLIALFVVSASFLQGNYSAENVQNISQQHDRLALSVVFGLFAVIVVLFAAKKNADYPRMVVLISGLLSFLTLLATRRLVSDVVSYLAQRGLIRLPAILLVGPLENMSDYIRRGGARLQSSTTILKAELTTDRQDPRFAAQLSAIRHQATLLGPDSVVLCLPWSERQAIEASAEQLATLPSALYLADDPATAKVRGLTRSFEAETVGHLLIRRPLSSSQLALKRAFDIAASSAGLILLSPVFAVIAILIKIDSPGPVLFMQRRYGYNRKPFNVFKFRTMTAQSSKEAYKQATRDDQRVTRIGGYLRRGSIDELPQLANVLLGHMSLVGPRPHPVELDDQFTPIIPDYMARHKIKPGITGWAQVNGHRGETSTIEQMQDRILHDAWYLNHWSFWLDIKIIFMTVFSLSSHRNAV